MTLESTVGRIVGCVFAAPQQGVTTMHTSCLRVGYNEDGESEKRVRLFAATPERFIAFDSLPLLSNSYQQVSFGGGQRLILG
jgi:hypothetical protein